MHLVDLVALLALLQFLVFASLVARARSQYGIRAPAVTGHEMFERAYRVQMNTLELLVLFLPALYLCAKYWPPLIATCAGAVFLVGRIIYQRAYMAAPARRSAGFVLSLAPCLVLWIAALAGVIKTLW